MDGASLLGSNQLLPPSPSRGWSDEPPAWSQQHGAQKQPTPADLPQLAAHPGRWWMLFWCAVICTEQGMIWNTFGPIAEAVEGMYLWDDGTISTMSNWGPISYMVAFIPTR